MQVIDEIEFRHTNETVARLLAINGASAPAAVAVLADIAIDNLGLTLDVRSIRERMERYGLMATNVARAPSLAAALRVTEGAPLIRLGPISDQLAKVRQIAPSGGLHDRDDEFSALAAFCGD